VQAQAHDNSSAILDWYYLGHSNLDLWQSYMADFLRSKDARERANVMGDIMRENFGGYVLALIIVLLAYAAVSMFFPQYTTGFAAVTLLGIVLFYFNKKKD
jgi:hypothetical protein